MTLGEKLSKLRKENNYTQEQLADVLNVSRQSVSKWEADINFPETDKLIEMSKLFDCSTDYLLRNEITDKHGVSNDGFANKLKIVSSKLSTSKTRQICKKILTIIALIFAVILAVDIISFAIYLILNGIPN